MADAICCAVCRMVGRQGGASMLGASLNQPLSTASCACEVPNQFSRKGLKALQCLTFRFVPEGDGVSKERVRPAQCPCRSIPR